MIYHRLADLVQNRMRVSHVNLPAIVAALLWWGGTHAHREVAFRDAAERELRDKA